MSRDLDNVIFRHIRKVGILARVVLIVIYTSTCTISNENEKR